VLSGYAAGISGTLVGHPMDSAKVWMQTNTKSRLLSSSSSTSNTTTAASSQTSTNGGKALQRAVGHNTTTIVSSLKPNMSTLAVGSQSPLSMSLRHVRALYSGVSGPLVTVGLVQSVNFAIYDSVRRMLYGMDRTTTTNKCDMEYLHHDSLTNVAVASMSAGFVLSIFTSPMLIIKTKQQTQGISFRQALQQTTMHNGRLSFRNIFRGFGPHFLSETLGRGVYFVAYEGIKRQFMARHENTTTATLQERMLSAAISGILCWSSIFPLDALRCRLYASADRQSALDMATLMYRENGIRTFYRGYVVTVLRAGPVAAAVLPIYDTCLETLSEMD